MKAQIIRLAPDVYVVDRLGIIQSQRELIQALRRPPLTWADYDRVRSRPPAAHGPGEHPGPSAP